MELGAKLFHRRHSGDGLVAEQVRLQAAQPYALDALHPGRSLDQAHQVGAGVLAVAGQVDAAEHHFFVAGGSQRRQLVQHALLAAAAAGAPGPGDDAVGAAAVAAVLHLEEGPGVALKILHGQFLEPLALFVGADVHHPLAAVQRLLDVLQHGGAAHVAHHHVRFLQPGGLFGKGLGIAPGHHRHRPGVLALGPPQPLAAFLVAPGGHGAAVHHIDIRRFAVRRQGVAPPQKQLLQRPGLVLIHLAAKGVKAHAHWVSPSTQRVFTALLYGPAGKIARAAAYTFHRQNRPLVPVKREEGTLC